MRWSEGLRGHSLLIPGDGHLVSVQGDGQAVMQDLQTLCCDPHPVSVGVGVGSAALQAGLTTGVPSPFRQIP